MSRLGSCGRPFTRTSASQARSRCIHRWYPAKAAKGDIWVTGHQRCRPMQPCIIASRLGSTLRNERGVCVKAGLRVVKRAPSDLAPRKRGSRAENGTKRVHAVFNLWQTSTKHTGGADSQEKVRPTVKASQEPLRPERSTSRACEGGFGLAGQKVKRILIGHGEVSCFERTEGISMRVGTCV